VRGGEAKEGLPIAPVASSNRVGRRNDIVPQHRPDGGATEPDFTLAHPLMVAGPPFEQSRRHAVTMATSCYRRVCGYAS
jgi:hypothetical protein